MATVVKLISHTGLEAEEVTWDAGKHFSDYAYACRALTPTQKTVTQKIVAMTDHVAQPHQPLGCLLLISTFLAFPLSLSLFLSFSICFFDQPFIVAAASFSPF